MENSIQLSAVEKFFRSIVQNITMRDIGDSAVSSLIPTEDQKSVICVDCITSSVQTRLTMRLWVPIETLEHFLLSHRSYLMD